MELDSEARRILELAREARTPSADDKARIERRFALALGLSAAASATAVAKPAAAAALTAKTAAAAAALKWTLGGCVLLAGAIAGYAALSATPARPAGVALPATVSSPAPDSARALPARAEPTRDRTPAAEPAKAPPAARAPELDARAVRGAEPHRRAATDASLAAELELLHAAQAAWRAGDAARALSLLSDHRRRHPGSALGLERDALRVLALCELGKQPQAEREARAWLARAPRSPLRASIEQSCAMK